MTPFSFEWQWNIEYLIFMGFLYLALLIIVCGLGVAWIKTWFELDMEEGSSDMSGEEGDRSRYGEY
jgi:hypothetical protein